MLSYATVTTALRSDFSKYLRRVSRASTENRMALPKGFAKPGTLSSKPLRSARTILFTVVADRGVRPDRSPFWLHKHVMVKRGQPIRQFSLSRS